MTLREWLAPPDPEADPRVALQWVRRMELVLGSASIALGLALWNQGWWHWLLIGSGLLAVSPWPGVRAILRKAERNPELLVSDPAQRRKRARRVLLAMVPLYALSGGVVGYIVDGWFMAIFLALLVGGGTALGARWNLRRHLD